jgi:hypothetical protein
VAEFGQELISTKGAQLKDPKACAYALRRRGDESL